MQIIALAVISSSIMVFCNLQHVSAQNSNTSNFVTYQNSTLGFSIQHPHDWKVEESTYDTGVKFMSLGSTIPIFEVRIQEVTPYLDTDTMTVKNKTLELVVQEVLNNISKPNPFGLESRVIRQNGVTVGGNMGWKIELFIGPQADPNYYYLFEVLSIASGRLYFLGYEEKPLNVPETLPLVNKMVESFRFT